MISDGHTIRGCMTDVLSDLGLQECKGNDCLSCNSNNCNADVVPKTRLRCHQCDNKNNAVCGMDIKTLAPTACLLYDTEASCYASAEKEGI